MWGTTRRCGRGELNVHKAPTQVVLRSAIPDHALPAELLRNEFLEIIG